MTREQEYAETVALKALAWLAADEALLDSFLGASGLAAADLAARAATPEMLAAVLDFILMDDAWVMAFCDSHALRYDRLMAVRQALPGGQSVHWS